MWQYILIGLLVIFGVVFHDFGAMIRVSIPAHRRVTSERLQIFWKSLFWVIIVGLTLMAGLRYRVGYDTIALHDNFRVNDIWYSSDFTHFIRGLGGRQAIIYSILHRLGLELWVWQMVCSVILNGMLALTIIRYTTQRFIALGLYIMLSFITLNFETMLAGASLAGLLWGLPDLQKSRWVRFYLKLFCGALFHLSILGFFWLPLLCLSPIRRWLRNWKILLILIVCSFFVAFFVRIAVLYFASVCDNIPFLARLGFDSNSVESYGTEMLSPSGFNAVGLVREGISALFALTCAWVLWFCKPDANLRRKKKDRKKKNRNKENPSGRRISDSDILALICVVEVFLIVMRQEVNGFFRPALMLWPIISIGVARSTTLIKNPVWLAGWVCFILLRCLLAVEMIMTPAPYVNDARRVEMYLPYSDYIEKGVVYRREWMMINYQNNHNPGVYVPKVSYPLYDFTFELHPGEKEIRSVLRPDDTHAAQEAVRQKKCGRDSVASVIPIQ